MWARQVPDQTSRLSLSRSVSRGRTGSDRGQRAAVVAVAAVAAAAAAAGRYNTVSRSHRLTGRAPPTLTALDQHWYRCRAEPCWDTPRRGGKQALPAVLPCVYLWDSAVCCTMLCCTVLWCGYLCTYSAYAVQCIRCTKAVCTVPRGINI